MNTGMIEAPGDLQALLTGVLRELRALRWQAALGARSGQIVGILIETPAAGLRVEVERVDTRRWSIALKGANPDPIEVVPVSIPLDQVADPAWIAGHLAYELRRLFERQFHPHVRSRRPRRR